MPVELTWVPECGSYLRLLIPAPSSSVPWEATVTVTGWSSWFPVTQVRDRDCITGSWLQPWPNSNHCSTVNQKWEFFSHLCLVICLSNKSISLKRGFFFYHPYIMRGHLFLFLFIPFSQKKWTFWNTTPHELEICLPMLPDKWHLKCTYQGKEATEIIGLGARIFLAPLTFLNKPIPVT